MPRTLESDRIQFAVIAIEAAAKKMGVTTAELTQRLQKQGLITADQALDKLVKEELRHQVCISKQEIIDKYLNFVSSEIL